MSYLKPTLHYPTCTASLSPIQSSSIRFNPVDTADLTASRTGTRTVNVRVFPPSGTRPPGRQTGAGSRCGHGDSEATEGPARGRRRTRRHGITARAPRWRHWCATLLHGASAIGVSPSGVRHAGRPTRGLGSSETRWEQTDMGYSELIYAIHSIIERSA